MPYVYFKISEQAKWGVDENGNYVPVYSRMKVNVPVDTSEKVDALCEMLASVMHIKKEHITVITKEEYYRETGEEEEFEDDEKRE